MANVTINQLTNATSIDGVVDLIPIYQNSSASTLSISRNTLLNLTSGPVGLTDIQTLTNKTLTNSTINSGTFSGTFSGTYTLGGTPTFPSNVVLTTSVQTLTNKTLTSPTINTPSITTPTVTGGSFSTPTISGGTMSAATLSTTTLTSGTTATGGMSVTGGLTVDSLSVSGSNTTNGWTGLGATLTYGANDGNKEFTLTTTTDLSTSVTPGMKIQLKRSTTPPATSANFNSSLSQYMYNVSPSGITFTNQFTIEAWVYMFSYGTLQGILNRSSGSTSGGWNFEITSGGQVRAFYGTGSSFTDFISNQAIPLNQWVHVAVSVSSTATKTAVIYINGTSVYTYSALTAATSLTQQSIYLTVAAQNNGTGGYFNGNITEVRLWSNAQTQTQIRANMGINLVGTETGLVGLWRLGNGDITDRTSNANNLTKSSILVTVGTTYPYNPIEYGIITSYSANTPTVGTNTITVYTGNSNVIPNQTLTNPYISTARLPYGFNGDRSNWSVTTLMAYQIRYNTPTANSWYNLGWSINIPTGAWLASYNSWNVATIGSGTSFFTVSNALSTSPTSVSDWRLYATADSGSYAGTEIDAELIKSAFINNSAITSWYLLIASNQSASAVYLGNSGGTTTMFNITAECAYL